MLFLNYANKYQRFNFLFLWNTVKHYLIMTTWTLETNLRVNILKAEKFGKLKICKLLLAEAYKMGQRNTCSSDAEMI